MVVHAGAEEARLRLGVRVPRGKGGQQVVDLGLGLAVRQIEPTAQSERLRNVLEELIDRGDADGVEHGPAVFVRGGGVAAHQIIVVPALALLPRRAASKRQSESARSCL